MDELLQTVGEQPEVGQVRQGVVLGQVVQALRLLDVLERVRQIRCERVEQRDFLRVEKATLCSQQHQDCHDTPFHKQGKGRTGTVRAAEQFVPDRNRGRIGRNVI